MEIISPILNFTIKDWLILITLFILMFCILEIRKLKRLVAQEIHRRLTPQLIFELVSNLDINSRGFYLKNESYFLAQDIEIEDVEVILNDSGFNKRLTLKFENVGSLKPQEKSKLNFRVFDREYDLSAEVKERIIPHLTSISFKVKLCYFNIENLKFCSVLSKKKDKFYIEKIEFYK